MTEIKRPTELWLEPVHHHGHFHAGEPVALRIVKGYNMQPDPEADYREMKAYLMRDSERQELSPHDNLGQWELYLEKGATGLMRFMVEQHCGSSLLLAQTVVEISHHHHGPGDHHHHHTESAHDEIHPWGLLLEILPAQAVHAHMGENYTVQVWRHGEIASNLPVGITYATTRHQDYPFRQLSDEEGKVRVFLGARGNYLFSAAENGCSATYCLMKDL